MKIVLFFIIILLLGCSPKYQKTFQIDDDYNVAPCTKIKKQKMKNIELRRALAVYDFFESKESLLIKEKSLIEYLEATNLFDRDCTPYNQLRKMVFENDIKRIAYSDERPTLISLT